MFKGITLSSVRSKEQLWHSCVLDRVQVSIIMRSLQDVYDMNAYMAGQFCLSVCPSVRMIQLENRWTDLDEVWYGLYAIGLYSKMVLAHWIGQDSLGVADPQKATAVLCPGRAQCGELW
jgi:hypothetical protein